MAVHHYFILSQKFNGCNHWIWEEYHKQRELRHTSHLFSHAESSRESNSSRLNTPSNCKLPGRQIEVWNRPNRHNNEVWSETGYRFRDPGAGGWWRSRAASSFFPISTSSVPSEVAPSISGCFCQCNASTPPPTSGVPRTPSPAAGWPGHVILTGCDRLG